MSFFAVSDLHLPGGDDKPMNVFGDHWEHHFERISESWRAQVREEDTVFIAGDTSWAMQLEKAKGDLEAIGALPGKKLLIRGNHDYWWSSIGKVRNILPAGMQAIQHNAIDVGDAVVCGTRGWTYASKGNSLSEEDERIFQRELIRLELALNAATKLANGKPIVVMLHFPPLYKNEPNTPFTELLSRYPVDTVIYGHLHAEAITLAFNGVYNGISYCLTSCDAQNFQVVPVSLGASKS